VSEPYLLFDRVWKKFHRGVLHDSLRDLIPTAMNRLLGRGPKPSDLEAGDFWAIRDLSFDVRPGQTLGIIGPNGSGKSTTLKVLTRIMAPTLGRAAANGRLGAMIEIAAGFHGDLTGRENVYLQGAIMGMRTSDIVKRFDQIVDFAGIADAIDTPVKRYSSGMSARLGFAIAAHLEPDILVIDEVLSVGDFQFQERAFGRLRDLARSGIPVIIVSHALERVAELCTEAILLTAGEVVKRGTPEEVIAAYVRRNAQASDSGNGAVEFGPVQIIGSDVVESGGICTVTITGNIRDDLPSEVDPVLIRVRSLRTGTTLYATGSHQMGVPLPRGPFSLRVQLQANLPAANYSIEVAARDMRRQADIASAQPAIIEVTNAGTWLGYVQLNATMNVEEMAGTRH
jgi:ABC-type polysaccharide/polyol phosphate transport system ATPase subunit